VEAEYTSPTPQLFRYYAGLANKVLGHVNPVPANASEFLLLREPVGVAAKSSLELSAVMVRGSSSCVAPVALRPKPAEQTPLT